MTAVGGSVLKPALNDRRDRRRHRDPLGLDLPPTILWAKPGVDALSAHVVDSLRAEDEAADDDPDLASAA